MNEIAPRTATRLTARALIVGERIDTAGLERPDMIAASPLAFRAGAGGMVALFRFGVAVMVGLSPIEEDDLLAKLKLRAAGPSARGDDETAMSKSRRSSMIAPRPAGRSRSKTFRRNDFSFSPTRSPRRSPSAATSARSIRFLT